MVSRAFAFHFGDPGGDSRSGGGGEDGGGAQWPAVKAICLLKVADGESLTLIKMCAPAFKPAGKAGGQVEEQMDG